MSINITSAWAVDRELFDIYLSLWLPLGVFGAPLAPPGPTVASVLTLLGALGLLWASFGCLWIPFGLPLGSLWLSLGGPWATLAILLKIGRPLPRNVSNS